jgi:hypothetical protein
MTVLLLKQLHSLDPLDEDDVMEHAKSAIKVSVRMMNNCQNSLDG